MTDRRNWVVVGLLLAVAGCGGSSGGDRATPTKTATKPATSGSYNADELAQALLPDVAGYVRSSAPQAGEYNSLAAVQNSTQMQQTVKMDKPQCAAASRALATDKNIQSAPAALVSYAKGRRQTMSETLMAVGPDIATQRVRLRVPASCRTFHTRVGNRQTVNQITEATGSRIGEGSHTIGVTTTLGPTTVHTWSVLLRSRGYLAAITLYGPNATRGEAETLARQAYQQAERILP